MSKIAFDIDGTLYKISRSRPAYEYPNYHLIAVLKWFISNGHEVYAWSAGGIDYAQQRINRLGLEGKVIVIRKEKIDNMDISFDDEEVNLAKVNIRNRRVYKSNSFKNAEKSDDKKSA